MKKITVLLTTFIMVLLVLVAGCTKNNQNNPKNKKKGNEEKVKTKGKKDNEIDINKLDIPERMKKAIKEGKIPKERVKMFLKMQKGNVPSVKVERIKKQKINSFLILNGVVEPEKKVEIYSRLSTYVKIIKKEEGNFVKKNDVLALLDDSEIRISYQQAKIQLKQSEITVQDEEKNHKRNNELKTTELISEKDFLTSELNLKKAKLDWENKFEIFKNQELQMNYTKIKSPVEGYITERLIEVGDKVNNNLHVYTIEDFSPLLIRVFVPTSDIINLKKGMETHVSTNVLKGLIYAGKVKLINPRIDVQSGTVKVTIEIFDHSMKLKPGMFVEVKILISNKPDAIVIPKKSITYKYNQPFIFILNKMQVFKREIKTGISEGDNIEILDGIEEGEIIVTVGVETLKDKMSVKVLK